MKVCVIEISSGKEKIMAKRFADILVKLKRAQYKVDTKEVIVAASLDLFSTAIAEHNAINTNEPAKPFGNAQIITEPVADSAQQEEKKPEPQKNKSKSADKAGD
jgi:hypothetical protein